MNKRIICLLFAVSVLISSIYADKSRFYENGKVIDTMYVNSEDGLKVRDYPSLKSNRLCGLPFRIPVKIIAIGKEEIIDGITAPWVEILIPRYEWKGNEPEYGWVFGGYLSKLQPIFNCDNWNNTDLQRYLTSKEWKMLVSYDEYAAVNFYANGSAEIKGLNKKWTFNYQALSGNSIKIFNMSDTNIRSKTVSMPPYSEINNKTYTLTFADNLHIDAECSALHLFYYIPTKFSELFTRRELYETDDFTWHSNSDYSNYNFTNYFDYYVVTESRRIREEYIQEFIISGLSAKKTDYEMQYQDYWKPIMEEHQKKADAME